MHMRFTLRRKALLWGVALVAVAMTLLAWLQARQLGDDYSTLIRDQQDAVAQQMADDLSDRLDTRLAMLERAALAVPPGHDGPGGTAPILRPAQRCEAFL
jgi:hypothetical protein